MKGIVPMLPNPVAVEAPPVSRLSLLVRRVALVWLVVAVLLWNLIALAQRSYPYFLLYYYLMFGLVGLPLWFNRSRVERALQRWRLSPLLKFLLLGYGMILLEETFAGLVNNLSEGFAVPLVFVRIGQFWAFNVLAFTGIV